ncbi:MAG: AAA family ATPase, partial [Bacteroidales bacterium]|nr:AAA family ATPase [Bacteroidales bacterium]
MVQYKTRTADEILSRKLQGTGAVLIVGPKWCGKTTTAEQQAKSKVYMDDIDEGANLRELATISPRGILKGDTPR